MAVHDHTAPARPPFPPGKAFSDPSDADPPASVPTTPSLRPATRDDIALALYALNVLSNEDEQCHAALARRAPVTELTTLPLPPLIREGLAVAMQCLEAYAVRLEPRGAANA